MADEKALGEMEKPNPATETVPQRRRIPLNVPRRKLEVDPIQGYVLYWFLDTDLKAATDAGYEFVEPTEVHLNQQNPATSAEESGNTDLGNKVTVLGNKIGEHGKPEHLVLMKIREEYWKEDRAILDAHNAKVIDTIFSGKVQGPNEDTGKTYVKSKTFTPGGILNRGLRKAT